MTVLACDNASTGSRPSLRAALRSDPSRADAAITARPPFHRCSDHETGVEPSSRSSGYEQLRSDQCQKQQHEQFDGEERPALSVSLVCRDALLRVGGDPHEIRDDAVGEERRCAH